VIQCLLINFEGGGGGSFEKSFNQTHIFLHSQYSNYETHNFDPIVTSCFFGNLNFITSYCRVEIRILREIVALISKPPFACHPACDTIITVTAVTCGDVIR
jgi:hypothetical protein